MKVLMLTTTSASVINFRKNLINHLIKNGFDVVVATYDNEREEDIKKLGVKVYCIKQNNRGINPFAVIKNKRQFENIIKQEQPDVLFTFQLKPNVLGLPLAKKFKIKKVFGMVEGLGDVFIKHSLKWNLIRWYVCKLYRKAFKVASKVFFLNNDDCQDFLDRKLIDKEKCVLIKGIGVDINHFDKKPIKNENTFLMVSRLLHTKGVYDYLKCAREVKKKYPDATFNYLGGEGDINVNDIKEYLEDGSVNYLGKVLDVRPYIENSSIVVLPSYREGFPVSIMEAEAMGRGIITTKTTGCKETVIEGYNGFLVDVCDYKQLAEKCITCLENPSLVKTFGENARKFAAQNFDTNLINSKILEVIEKW